MKKMYLIFGMGVFMSFGLVSCSPSIFRQDVSTNKFIQSNIANFPLVSDLQVGAKKAMPMRLYTKITLDEAKENILYDFMKEHNCDVVVEPMFSTEIITRGIGETKVDVKIEMTGFVGNYANIRNFEPKDSTRFLLGQSLGNTQDVSSGNVAGGAQPVKKKRKTGKIILKSVLGIVGVALLLSLFK